MKKILSIGLISAFLAQSALCAEDVSPKEKKLREQTQRMQKGITWKKRAKQAAIGAGAGAAAGASVGAVIGGAKELASYKSTANPNVIDPISPIIFTGLGGVEGGTIGAVLGATTGASVAAIRTAIKNRLLKRQRHKINAVLKRRTALDQFEKLPIGQAMLVFAAYRRDSPGMKLIVTKIQASPEESVRGFLNESMWKALAELYFNEHPTKNLVERLQRMVAEGK